MNHLTPPNPPPSDDSHAPRGASEPADAAALLRFELAVRAALPEPVEPGLAERLALRVRDQVALEERTAQRLEAEAAPRGWRRFSARTRIRLVLASLAVHVAVLGWVVLHDRPRPVGEEGRVVNIGRAEPSPDNLPREPEAPYDLGALLLAEQVPDALLERHGLLETEEPLASEPRGTEQGHAELRVAEHPAGVGLDMLRRMRATVKSRRLERLGLDAGGTLAAVQRGLDALAARQAADGAFAPDLTLPAGERPALGEVGRTALALLPFLAEGRSSVGAGGAAGEPVVERGLGFLRQRLAAGNPSSGTPSADDLALSLLALSEDYMLAYGRWTPGQARERAVELQVLTGRMVALQRADGGFSGQASEAPLWPLLALDAAAHTGVAVPSASSRERLTGWFASLPRAGDGLPAGSDGRPDLLLAAGEALLARSGAASASTGAEGLRTLVARSADIAETPATGIVAGLALYRRDPAAFRDLGRRQGAALLARLGESGVARRGDAVTDTALLLLALQAAYRVY